MKRYFFVFLFTAVFLEITAQSYFPTGDEPVLNLNNTIFSNKNKINSLNKNEIKVRNRISIFNYNEETNNYATDTEAVFHYYWYEDGTPKEIVGFYKNRNPLRKIVVKDFVEYTGFQQYDTEVPGYFAKNHTYYDLDISGKWFPISRYLNYIENNVRKEVKYERNKNDYWILNHNIKYLYDSLGNYMGYIEHDVNTGKYGGLIDSYFYDIKKNIASAKRYIIDGSGNFSLFHTENYYKNINSEINAVVARLFSDSKIKIQDSTYVYSWNQFQNKIELQFNEPKKPFIATHSLPDSSVVYRFDTINQNWLPYQKNWNNFNGQGYLIYSLLQEFNGNSLNSVSTSITSYYSNNNVKSNIINLWENEKWEAYSTKTYTNNYDDDDDLLQKDFTHLQKIGTSTQKTGNRTKFDYALIWPANVGLSISNEFNIYPNPSNNFIIIQDKNEPKKLIISVFDLSGRKVFSKEIYFNSEYFLDVSELNYGVYFLNLEAYKSTKMIKFLKQ